MGYNHNYVALQQTNFFRDERYPFWFAEKFPANDRIKIEGDLK